MDERKGVRGTNRRISKFESNAEIYDQFRQVSLSIRRKFHLARNLLKAELPGSHLAILLACSLIEVAY
jgi:hypothetical protein